MGFRRSVSRILRRSGRLLDRLANHVYQSPQQKRVASWNAANGDKTLRFDYDLDADSIVLDLGGYEGEWSAEIYARYSCYIHVFEPVPEFAQRLQERFAHNRKVIVHPFGLGAETRSAQISLDRDRSSLFGRGGVLANCRLVNAADLFTDASIGAVDLAKINIEGGEYDLLEHLIATGFISRIRNIQVQFHDFVPDAERRMHGIQKALQRTHDLTYQYPFVWENWALKRDTSGPF